jgi:sugar O-acyltransferase (sialic acid O-acetyltransferase NeuD family)
VKAAAVDGGSGAPVAFVGYGALGRQLEGLLRATGAGPLQAVFDDPAAAAGHRNAHPFDAYDDPAFADHAFVVALGYRHLARKAAIVDELRSAGRQLLSLVHPTAFVHPEACLGEGVVVYPMANIDQGVEVASGVLLNNSVVLSHETRVGAASYLSPGVVTSGRVEVGAQVFLGSRVTIANDLQVGDGAVVGVGSVVTRDLPAGAQALGNPARIRDRPLRLL